MSRSLLFRSLAKNLGESPDLVLKRINKIHVSVSYKGAGQTGLRKLVQEYSAGIRLSNPSMAFTAKIIAEKDFVPTVDLETGDGVKKTLQVLDKKAEEIVEMIKEQDKIL